MSTTTAPCRQAEGIAPPACCQPVPSDSRGITPEWHAAYVDRMTRRHTQLRAVTPRRCPDCGSGVYPLFWGGLDVYGCDVCPKVISGRGD